MGSAERSDGEARIRLRARVARRARVDDALVRSVVLKRDEIDDFDADPSPRSEASTTSSRIRR